MWRLCVVAGPRGTAATRQGLTPRARVAGVGIGPAPATRKVLELTGLTLAQMDVIVLTEAFAAHACSGGS